MKKNVYSKLLLAPLTALVFSACSSSLYNQPQEYDDIYATSASKKQAPIKQKPVQPSPINVENEKFTEVQKAYTVEEYSPEYVDPAIVNKYNNGNERSTNPPANQPLMVFNANDLSYDAFLWDYERGHLQNDDLPLDWGTGYWSEIQFNNRVARDFQFRNAWYDYYYNGYNGSLTNYYARYNTANRNYASRINFAVWPSFRPRFRVSLGFGFGFGSFYDPFYDPFFYSGYGGWTRFYNPYFNNSRYYFGSSYWCPPIYNAWDPFYSDRRYYGNSYVRNSNRIYVINAQDGANSRDIQRGGRVTRSSVASVRNDAVSGTTGGRTRSTANSGSLSLRGEKNNGILNGRSTVNMTDQARRSTSNVSQSGNTRSQLLRTRSNISNVNSDVTPRDYEFNTRGNTRSSSNVRSRSSRVNNQTTQRSQASRDSYYGRTSNDRTNSSFSRSSNRSINNSRSGSGFSRSSNSRSGSSLNRGSSSRQNYSNSRTNRSGSSSRSSGVSRSGSSSRSSGTVRRGSSSRSSGTVSRGSSSRSSSGSRSSGKSTSSSRSSSAKKTGTGRTSN